MAPNRQNQQQEEQPSIRSFFQPKKLPKYAAPPSSQSQPPPSAPPAGAPVVLAAPPPPAAPPLPSSPVAVLQQQSDPSPLFTTAPRFPPAPSPHPSATIVPLAAEHIPALRRINALLLPVNYADSFYAAALDPAVSGLLSRVVLWQDDPQQPSKVIGGIVCRIDPSPFSAITGVFDPKLAAAQATTAADASQHAVYIQSLGLLAPYRGQGIAAAAVEAVVRDAAALSSLGTGLRVTALYAHVWTENEDGLRWYAARGFARDVVLGGYYFKLRPDTAWVVKRAIVASAPLPPPPSQTNGAGSAPPQAAAPAPPIAASTTAAAVNLPGFAGAAAVRPPPQPLTRAPPSSSNGNNPSASPSPAPSTSLSFQNKRPDMEWNDLPEEMVSRNSSRSDLLSPSLPLPPNGGSSGAGPPRSGASSRSSSTAPARKKKDRAYPAAAFGGS